MNKTNFIGLGTAAIGRPQYINLDHASGAPFSLRGFKQEGLKMIDSAYAAGIRYFDTAPGYGLAEELMIDWLGRQNDPTITVATKWGYTYIANFDPNARVHEVKDHSLDKLNEQWKISNQLKPYLKYYQIHSATLETGVLENEAVLDRLYEIKKENNIKVGLSTTGSNQIEVLLKALDIHRGGEQLFEVYQCTYNVLDQSIYELGCQILADKKKLVIKEALANGRLFPNKVYPQYAPLYKSLKKLSRKYEVGVDAILLQFCLANLEGAMILSGANKTEHLVQNLKSNDFELSFEDLEDLGRFKTSPMKYWKERQQLSWN